MSKSGFQLVDFSWILPENAHQTHFDCVWAYSTWQNAFSFISGEHHSPAWKTNTLYFAPSISPSTLMSFPVPVDENHPHSMGLPPPCFTVGGSQDDERCCKIDQCGTSETPHCSGRVVKVNNLTWLNFCLELLINIRFPLVSFSLLETSFTADMWTSATYHITDKHFH